MICDQPWSACHHRVNTSGMVSTHCTFGVWGRLKCNRQFENLRHHITCNCVPLDLHLYNVNSLGVEVDISVQSFHALPVPGLCMFFCFFCFFSSGHFSFLPRLKKHKLSVGICVSLHGCLSHLSLCGPMMGVHLPIHSCWKCYRTCHHCNPENGGESGMWFTLQVIFLEAKAEL